MSNFIKILSMHFADEGVNKDYHIKEARASEVLETMQAHALMMRSLHYFPKTESTPTKVPDTPTTIKSAMSAQLNSTRGILSQNFVDYVAGK